MSGQLPAGKSRFALTRMDTWEAVSKTNGERFAVLEITMPRLGQVREDGSAP